MRLHDPAALSRARSLAVPVASCAAAGIGTGHLTDGLSRDDLLVLLGILAEAADPVAVRDLVRDPAGRRRDPEVRARMLRAAHAQAEACRKSRPTCPAAPGGPGTGILAEPQTCPTRCGSREGGTGEAGGGRADGLGAGAGT